MVRWEREGWGDIKKEGMERGLKHNEMKLKGRPSVGHDSSLMSFAVALRNRFFQSITFNSLSLAPSLFLFLFIFGSLAFSFIKITIGGVVVGEVSGRNKREKWKEKGE